MVKGHHPRKAGGRVARAVLSGFIVSIIYICILILLIEGILGIEMLLGAGACSGREEEEDGVVMLGLRD